MGQIRLFDKHGHLYNFKTIDVGDNDLILKGELFFDTNSTNTFKTLGLYLLEDVNSYEITSDYLLNRLQYHNKINKFNFIKGNNILECSSNINQSNYTYIVADNSSNLLLTKLIHQKNIGIKFPVGSIIEFEPIGFANDTNAGINHPKGINGSAPNGANIESLWVLLDLTSSKSDFLDSYTYDVSSYITNGVFDDTFDVKLFKVILAEKDRILISSYRGNQLKLTQNGLISEPFVGVSNYYEAPTTNQIYSGLNFELYNIGFTGKIISHNCITLDTNELYNDENLFKEKTLQVFGSQLNNNCFNIEKVSNISYYNSIKFYFYAKSNNYTLLDIWREAQDLKYTQFIDTNIHLKLKLNTFIESTEYILNYVVEDDFLKLVESFKKFLNNVAEYKIFKTDDSEGIVLFLPYETPINILTNDDLKTPNELSQINPNNYNGGVLINYLLEPISPLYTEVSDFLFNYSYITVNSIMIKDFLIPEQEETSNKLANVFSNKVITLPVIQDVVNEVNKNYNINYTKENPLIVRILELEDDLNIYINGINYNIEHNNLLNDEYYPTADVITTVQKLIAQYEEELEKRGIRVIIDYIADDVFPSQNFNVVQELIEYPNTLVGAKDNGYIIIEDGLPVKRPPILLKRGEVYLKFLPIVEDLLIDYSIKAKTFRVKQKEIIIDNINIPQIQLKTNTNSGAEIILRGDSKFEEYQGELLPYYYKTAWTLNNFINQNFDIDYPDFPNEDIITCQFNVTGTGPLNLNITSGIYLNQSISFTIAPQTFTIPSTNLLGRIDLIVGDKYGNLSYIIGNSQQSPQTPIIPNGKVAILKIICYEISLNLVPDIEVVKTNVNSYQAKKTNAINRRLYPEQLGLSYNISNINKFYLKIPSGKYEYNPSTFFDIINYIIEIPQTSLDRIDILYGDNLGNLNYITGTPSVTPSAPSGSGIGIVQINYYSDTNISPRVLLLDTNYAVNKKVYSNTSDLLVDTPKIYGPWQLQINNLEWSYNNKSNTYSGTYIIASGLEYERIDNIIGDYSGNTYYILNQENKFRDLIAISTYETTKPIVWGVTPKIASPWVTPYFSGLLEDPGIYVTHKLIPAEDETLNLPLHKYAINKLEFLSNNKDKVSFELNLDSYSDEMDENIGCFIASNQIDLINIDFEIYADFNLKVKTDNYNIDLKLELSGIVEEGTVLSTQHLISQDNEEFVPLISVNIITNDTIANTNLISKISIEEVIPPQLIPTIGGFKIERTLRYNFYSDFVGGFLTGDDSLGSLNKPLNTYNGLVLSEEIYESGVVEFSGTYPDSFKESKIFYINRVYYSNDNNNMTKLVLEGQVEYKRTDLYLDYNLPTQNFIVNNDILFTETDFSTGSLINLSGSLYYGNNKNYNILNIADVYNQNTLIGSKLVVDYQGPFIEDYNEIKLFMDTTMRYPRGLTSENPTKKIRFRWQDSENFTDSIFLYDISGLNIKPENNIMYGYIDGEKNDDYFPLWQPEDNCKETPQVFLNKTPNTDPAKALESKYQQTVFDILDFDILPSDYTFISNIECGTNITPMQVFVGYNDPNEGTVNKTLIIEEVLDMKIVMTRTISNDDYIYSVNVNGISQLNYISNLLLNSNYDSDLIDKKIKELNREYNQLTTINNEVVLLNSRKYNVVFDGDSIIVDDYFIDFQQLGILPDFYIKITGRDITNPKFKANIKNNNTIAKVKSVGKKHISFYYNFINETNEFYIETNYNNTTGQYNTSLTLIEVTLEVIPKQIAEIKFLGESESEDLRYTTWLSNFDINIGPETTQIFEEYDIDEKGVDLVFLNNKRKEMLLIQDTIYNYIGSYKSLLNTISYFGLETLKLNEYYKNINRFSENYGKLFKVQVNNDYLGLRYPNTNFIKTDLLNLSYEFTDRDGNFVSNLNINSLIFKLQKLKHLLRDNILPLTSRIEDITLTAYFPQNISVQHSNNRLIAHRSALNEIYFPDFKVDAYSLGINTLGSRNDLLNIHIEFISDNVKPFTMFINTYRQLNDEEIEEASINELNRILLKWYEFLDYNSLETDLQLPQKSLLFNVPNLPPNPTTIVLDGVEYIKVTMSPNSASSIISSVNTYELGEINYNIMNYNIIYNKISNNTIQLLTNNYSLPIIFYENDMTYIIWEGVAYEYQKTPDILYKGLIKIIENLVNLESNMRNYIIDKRRIFNFSIESNYVPELTDKLILIQSITEYKTDLTSYNFALNKSVDPYFEVLLNVNDGRGVNLNLRRTYQVLVEGVEDVCNCIEKQFEKYVKPLNLNGNAFELDITNIQNQTCYYDNVYSMNEYLGDSCPDATLTLDTISNDNFPFKINIDKSGTNFLSNLCTNSISILPMTGSATLSNAGNEIQQYSPLSIEILDYLNDTPIIIENLPRGVYTIKYTDVFLRESIKVITISGQTSPSEAIVSYKNIICNGGTGEINYDFNIDCTPISVNLYRNGISYANSVNATGSFTGLPDGLYTIEVEYCTNCIRRFPNTLEQQTFAIIDNTIANLPSPLNNLRDKINIINPPIFDIVVLKQNYLDVCYGQMGGELQINVVGGVPDYTLNDVQLINIPLTLGVLLANTTFLQTTLLNAIESIENTIINGLNNNINTIFNNIPSGTYQIEYKDLYGCITTENIPISDVFDVSATEIEVLPEICYGQSNGSIELKGLTCNDVNIQSIDVLLVDNNNVFIDGYNYVVPISSVDTIFSNYPKGLYNIQLVYNYSPSYSGLCGTSEYRFNLGESIGLFLEIEGPDMLVMEFVIQDITYISSLTTYELKVDIIIKGANRSGNSVYNLVEMYDIVSNTFKTIPYNTSSSGVVIGNLLNNDTTYYNDNDIIIKNMRFYAGELLQLRITDALNCVTIVSDNIPSELDIISILNSNNSNN